MSEHFAVTYRKHATKLETVLESSFLELLTHLGGKLVHKVFEKDSSKDHVHLHGVVKIAKGFYRKHLSLKGFNMKIKPIWDMTGWLAYLKKDVALRNTIKFELGCLDQDDRLSKMEANIKTRMSPPGTLD